MDGSLTKGRYNVRMLSALLAIAVAGPSLDQKIAELMPTKDEEKWLSIPWRTDLNQARADAQREGKPIFLWVMNGHPMGCT